MRFDDLPPAWADRVEVKLLPLTPDFATEKRAADQRGEIHLIQGDELLKRIGLFTLEPGQGYRGGHYHLAKREGLYVAWGRGGLDLAHLETGQRLELDLEPGLRVWIRPGVAHRVRADETLTVVEMNDQPYQASDDRPFSFD